MSLDSEVIQHRITVIGVFVLFLMGIIVTRLVFLQVLTGSEYLKIAKENKIRVVALDAPRGTIYDRSGRTMIGNRSALTVAVNMLQMAEEDAAVKNAVIGRLSSVLGMPIADISKRLENQRISPYRPVPVKEDVPQELAVYIMEHQLDFPHVVIEGRPLREYANGPLAAHVLGYLGEISDKELENMKSKGYVLGDTIGRDGVEASYETDLAGKKGEQRIEVNAAGYPISSVTTKNPEAGKNIHLTIDKDLQALSESLLAEALIEARQSYDRDTKKNYNAPSGAVVVMNPQNGEVLAMASQPSYDPRLFTEGISEEAWRAMNDPNNHYPMNNRAVNNSFPPGSTIKIVTATAAMQEGVASADSTYKCTGKWTGAGAEWPQYCWKRSGHGRLSLEQGIIDSCDSVFYEIGYSFYKLIGSKGERMQEWASRFGLGAPTGIDLPGEDGGRLPTKAWKEKWNKDNEELMVWFPGDSTNLAIGQGDLLATPLQMAVAYSALANGGTVYEPHVVKRIESSDKDYVRDIKPKKLRNLNASADVLAIIGGDLTDVVSTGTGKSAFAGFPLSDIPIAGKTGSAETYGKQANAWFAAFAPADDPQYVVVVVIEEGGHGVSAAAPVVRKIYDSIFGLESDSAIRIESTVD